MRIEVTQDDIGRAINLREARRHGGSDGRINVECPLALAFTRAFGIAFSVSYSTASPNKTNRPVYRLPPEAEKLSRDFTRGFAVHPLTFEVVDMVDAELVYAN
jgi:hypothetical protein